MATKLTATYEDYSLELSTVGFWSYDVDETTIEAWFIVANALLSEIGNITIGSLKRADYYSETDDIVVGGPTSPQAQREIAWRCTYQDDTTGKFHTWQIPCADLALLQTNSDELDTSPAAMVSWKAAFNALAVAPDTGNAVEFKYGKLVGRNL